jgi:DNA mismatch repair protein MutS2
MSSCLQHLEWPRLCEHLDARLASPLAYAGRDREGDPAWSRSMEPAVVERWLDEQDGLEAALSWHPELAPVLGAQLRRVEALADELSRAARGVALEPVELLAVGGMADALGRLAPLCQPPDPSVSAAASDAAAAGHAALVLALPGLRPHAELAALLLRSIALDGPQGEAIVADAASPALARARSQVRTARQSLVRGAERLVRGAALSEALADRYWTEREGRVVLPVRSSSFSRVGGSGGTVTGIIHGASTTGHTLFVEPHELVDDNNRRCGSLARGTPSTRGMSRISSVAPPTCARPAWSRPRPRMPVPTARRTRLETCGSSRSWPTPSSASRSRAPTHSIAAASPPRWRPR